MMINETNLHKSRVRVWGKETSQIKHSNRLIF